MRDSSSDVELLAVMGMKCICGSDGWRKLNTACLLAVRYRNIKKVAFAIDPLNCGCLIILADEADRS